MKILLDHDLPAGLVPLLAQHFDLTTTRKRGWDLLDNGDLLTAASGEFDVFVTADKSLRYQQNLSRFAIAVVVVPFQRLPELEPIIERVIAAIRRATAGTATVVEAP